MGPQEKRHCGGYDRIPLCYLKEEYKRPSYLELKRVQNRTSEHIDVRILTNELQTNLIKKRIRFIDRSMTEDALKEMEMGMTGMIDPDSAVPVGNLKSPNFYLAGDISDNVRRVGSNNIQYLVVTLKLVELSTGITVWQDQKEFLKTSSANRITF